MQDETWIRLPKEIDERFEYYHISSLGRVKSEDRTIFVERPNGGNYNLFIKEAILNPVRNTNNGKKGYLLIPLGSKKNRKRYKVHRLIATYFIPNPNNLPVVNHLNGIKTDNRVENLEWTTAKGNRNHAQKLGLMGGMTEKKLESIKNAQKVSVSRTSKKVICNKTGVIYPSIAEAARVVGISWLGYMLNGTKPNTTSLALYTEEKKD